MIMQNGCLPGIHRRSSCPGGGDEWSDCARRILDLFFTHGYELVVPPMLEYLESLLTGTGHDLDLKTFKLVDQFRPALGLRADITPQVARIDAHLLNRKGVTRCVMRARCCHAAFGLLRTARMQIGAEIMAMPA